MKPRITLTLLILVFFSVSVAAKNDGKKPKHLSDLECAPGEVPKMQEENRWACAADNTSDARVLVDANDQVIGSLLDVVGPNQLLVQLNLDGYSFKALASNGYLSTEGLTRISADLGETLYIDDQCSGDLYAGYDQPYFIFESEPYAILLNFDPVEGRQKWALIEVKASSAFPSPTYDLGSGECRPTWRTYPNVVPLNILIDDVAALYPGPYRIAE